MAERIEEEAEVMDDDDKSTDLQSRPRRATENTDRSNSTPSMLEMDVENTEGLVGEEHGSAVEVETKSSSAKPKRQGLKRRIVPARSSSDAQSSPLGSPEPQTRKKGGNKRKFTHEYCLTCKKYGRACSGRIDNLQGGCSVCRDPDREKGEKLRECLWAKPEQGINTYEEARIAHKAAQKAARDARKQAQIEQRRLSKQKSFVAAGTSAATVQLNRQLNVLPPPRESAYGVHSHEHGFSSAPHYPGTSIARQDSDTIVFAKDDVAAARPDIENDLPLDTDEPRIHRPTLIRLSPREGEATQSRKLPSAGPRYNARGERVHKLSKPLQLAPPPMETPASLPAPPLPLHLLDPRTGQWYAMVAGPHYGGASPYRPAPGLPTPAFNSNGYISPYDAPPVLPDPQQLQDCDDRPHNLPRPIGAAASNKAVRPAKSWVKQEKGVTSIDGSGWKASVWSPGRKSPAADPDEMTHSTGINIEDAANRLISAATNVIEARDGELSSVLSSTPPTPSLEGCILEIDIPNKPSTRYTSTADFESAHPDLSLDRGAEDQDALLSDRGSDVDKINEPNAKPDSPTSASPALAANADEDEDDRLLGILGQMSKERDAAAKASPMASPSLPRLSSGSEDNFTSASVKSAARSARGRPKRASTGPPSVVATSHVSGDAPSVHKAPKSSISTRAGRITKPSAKTLDRSNQPFSDSEHDTSTAVPFPSSIHRPGIVRLKLNFSLNTITDKGGKTTFNKNHKNPQNSGLQNDTAVPHGISQSTTKHSKLRYSSNDDERPTKLRKTALSAYNTVVDSDGTDHAPGRSGSNTAGNAESNSDTESSDDRLVDSEMLGV